jgi:hypothetical protein
MKSRKEHIREYPFESAAKRCFALEIVDIRADVQRDICGKGAACVA